LAGVAVTSSCAARLKVDAERVASEDSVSLVELELVVSEFDTVSTSSCI
jgi:hypothetical protein